MSFKKRQTCISICVLVLTSLATIMTQSLLVFGEVASDPQEAAGVEFITSGELKTKLAKNQPVTIIDVRATSGLSDSDSKIQGAIYVKLRRLRTRLAFPPLKDVPRDREIVTYCACPNDESSVRAARLLSDAGFKHVRVLRGGWLGWRKAKGPIESMARGD